jgi:hypothetical protein
MADEALVRALVLVGDRLPFVVDAGHCRAAFAQDRLLSLTEAAAEPSYAGLCRVRADIHHAGHWRVSWCSDPSKNIQVFAMTAKLKLRLKLLLATAMMCAGAALIAFAGPSATFTAQIVGATAGTPCDIGPNYTGSIPAGAQAAGFTHCAANYDFTVSTNFTYNGHSYNLTNTSTWLDTCGATYPLWYVTASDGVGNPATCNAWSITTDGGTQVLQMHWDPSFMTSPIYTTGMQTSGAVDFPLGSYFQATYRSTTGSFGDPRGSGAPFVSAWWSWQANNPVLEIDFLETYAYSAATGKGLCGSMVCGAGAGAHDWGTNGSFPIATYEASGGSGYDPTIYETIGTRVTNDGSTNVAGCGYLNNTFLSCGVSGNLSQPSQYQNRSYLIMYDGPQANDGYTPTVAQDIFVKSIVVFSCANWRSGQCLNNPVLTTAP